MEHILIIAGWMFFLNLSKMEMKYKYRILYLLCNCCSFRFQISYCYIYKNVSEDDKNWKWIVGREQTMQTPLNQFVEQEIQCIIH